MTPTERTALGLGAGASALYLVSAAPGGVWYDTPELAAAAYRLGVSHPPGQALHSVLGKAATFLPVGSVLLRTNVLSALSAGAAVALLFWVARRMAAALGVPPARSTLAAVAAAVALALSDVLVGQATRTEVYAPAFLLFVLGLGFAVRWCAGPRDVRLLGLAGLAAGLAATLHPPAGISVVLATAWLALLVDPRAALRPRGIAAAVIGVLVGLLPLLLLVFRCSPDRQPCWVVEMSPIELLRYVAGRGYAHNLQVGAAMIRAVADALRFVLLRTGVLPVLLLAGIVLVSTLRARAPRRWGAAYLGAFLLPLPLLAVMPFEEANPDIHGYLLPAVGMLFAATGATIAWLPIGGRAVGAVLLLGLLAPSLAATRIGSVVRTRYVLPDALQEATMSEPPPRALLVTSSDQMYMAALYAQLVEADRPDVVVMAAGLCGTKRHWHDARRRRPWLDLARARSIAREVPGRTLQDRMAAAALVLARDRAPRAAESPHWTPGHAVAHGATFDLDAHGQGEDAPLPATLAREFERHRDRYADGGDRIYRRLRQHRADALLLRGRPRAAARELVRALWELSPADREAFDSLPARVDALRPEPGLRHVAKPWISDEHDVRRQLASLAFQVGRSDLAARALLPSYQAGDPFAVLLQADMLARDGKHEEAERAYRAFAAEYPEEAALGELGLALLSSHRGRHREAVRHIERAREAEGSAGYEELLGAARRWVERRTSADGGPPEQ